MPIPGFSGLKAHLPDYSEKQIKLIVARLPSVTIICLCLSLLMDNLIRWLYQSIAWFFLINIEPWIPIIIPLILILGGSLTAQTGFVRKHRLLKEDKIRAYQKVAKLVFTGIPMVFAGLLYGYFTHGQKSILNFTRTTPINSVTEKFSTSLVELLFNGYWDFFPRIIFGCIFLILAILTAFRAVKEFGVDTAALLYVYYPEEAKIIHNDIYSVVRHPMYMAVIMISIGGFIFNLSIYSFLHLIITLGSFTFHILYREEKELYERFGDSYKEYAKKVPAIIIRPKNWGKYLKFVFGKK